MAEVGGYATGGNLPHLATPELRGRIVATGLELPEDLTFEEWERDLQVVWWLYEWSPWALADALNYGAQKWPERYQQAVAITGRALQTLYNKTSLARQFPIGLRSEVLTPGHHEVLSGLDDDQKRRFLKEGEQLDKESNGHLTVRAFDGYVKDQLAAGTGKAEKVQPPFRCPDCFGSGVCPMCHGSGEEPV